MNVVAVPSLQNESDSYSIADSILHSLLEFQPEQWGLPRFEDCLFPDFIKSTVSFHPLLELKHYILILRLQGLVMRCRPNPFISQVSLAMDFSMQIQVEDLF